MFSHPLWLLCLWVLFFLCTTETSALKVLISNDDSWATANIRAIYQAARRAGHHALISAPAMQQSGTGGRMADSVPLSSDGEFGAVKKGAPAQGHDASDDHIWYVNSTPASSVKYGLEVLSPRYFGGPADLVVAGTNQGFNLGLAYLVSGTFGAAKYAISQGIPGLAFSAGDESIRPYTQLGGAEDQANVYAESIMLLLSTLEKSAKPGQPLLPTQTGLNVNFPSAVERKCRVEDAKWMMSRLLASMDRSPDACLCGHTSVCKLPTEETLERGPHGCTNSITVFGTSLFDPDASPWTQRAIADRLHNMTTCDWPISASPRAAASS